MSSLIDAFLFIIQIFHKMQGRALILKFWKTVALDDDAKSPEKLKSRRSRNKSQWRSHF